MGWGCHTYSFTISLSRAHHLESITSRRLWLQFEWSMWRSHTVSLLSPPHPSIRPSLSLLHAVPLSPSTLANRGNYALNWHPVYTLNRHQLQLCDTRTNTSMLSLPLHFPRSLSVTHPANGKEGCFSLTSSGGMSGWRCLWRRNTWVTGGYGAGLEHQEKEANSYLAYTRKQLFINKRSAAALPGSLSPSENNVFRLALHSYWAENDQKLIKHLRLLYISNIMIQR